MGVRIASQTEPVVAGFRSASPAELAGRDFGFRDARLQRRLRGRIGLVVAGAEHGKGESAGRERGFVRGGIDAGGESTGDADAGAGQH